MPRLLRNLLVAALAIGPCVAPLSAQTAAKAVAILQQQYGKVYASRLVAVTGVNGGPQPKEWHLFAYDLKQPTLISHFVVKGGKLANAAMLDAQRSKQWAAPVIGWDKVKTDSEQVFKLADAAARAAAVGFNAIDYRLMADRTTRVPVYQVELRDAAGKSVGRLKIDGAQGRVLSQSWGGVLWNGQDRLDWQIVKQEMGKAGRDIGAAFRKLGDNVSKSLKR